MPERICSSRRQPFSEQIIRFIIAFIFLLAMLGDSHHIASSLPLSSTVIPTQSINIKFFVSATLTRQPTASTSRKWQISKQQSQSQYPYYTEGSEDRKTVMNKNVKTLRDSLIPRQDFRHHIDYHKRLDEHSKRHEFNLLKSSIFENKHKASLESKPTTTKAKMNNKTIEKFIPWKSIKTTSNTARQRSSISVVSPNDRQSLVLVVSRENEMPERAKTRAKQTHNAINQIMTKFSDVTEQYQDGHNENSSSKLTHDNLYIPTNSTKVNKTLPTPKSKSGWYTEIAQASPPKRATRDGENEGNPPQWIVSLPDSSAARTLSTLVTMSDCNSKSASLNFYDIFSRNFKLGNFFETTLPPTLSSTVLPTTTMSSNSPLLNDNLLFKKSKERGNFNFNMSTTTAKIPSSSNRNLENTSTNALINSNNITLPWTSLITGKHNVADVTTTSDSANGFLPLDANVFLPGLSSPVFHSNTKSSENKHQQRKNNTKTGTVTVWQLYNHCSAGFLEAFLSVADARGRVQDHCLINFLVHSMKDGTIALEQAQTRRFVCFNRRKRLTVKRSLKNDDSKCRFREHMTTSGYTLLESAHTPKLFLGFNRRGRFQEPSKFADRRFRQCFHYSKLEMEYRNDSGDCRNGEASQKENNLRLDQQSLLYEIARNSLLDRIEI